MKIVKLLSFLGILLLIKCGIPEKKTSEFSAVSQTEAGRPVSVMLTCYNTTLLANGKDQTPIRIAVRDSAGREITTAKDTIHIYITGDASVTATNGNPLPLKTDTAGIKYSECQLLNGLCHLIFIAGNHPDKIKVEARSGKLWPGSSEIHTIPADFKLMTPKAGQLHPTTNHIGRMIGADISFLPQIEARRGKFYENGKETDAIKLLHEHGMNYIRLRIFVHPENEKGYSPGKGYCGLKYTLEMAKRIKSEGMKLLLDFHYSDYWADPQQQYKPLAWKDLNFATLKDSVKTYTTNVLLDMKNAGTMPDMVQIGNEINHGILWPDGYISHPDQLADLLKAAFKGVETADSTLPVMVHLALGGQNKEAVFWLNNMIARGVQFDVIGLSYYPRWHGTLDDLQNNMRDLVNRYHKPLIVAEYSEYKKAVNDIVFNLPDDLGKGTCIWEPLNWRSGLFDRNGNTTSLMSVYDTLHKEYLTNSE